MKDVNLEIFNENIFIKTIANRLKENEKDPLSLLVLNIENDPNADHSKSFNDLFLFNKENQFDDGTFHEDNALVRYKIKSVVNDNEMYVNIGKRPYHSDQNEELIQHTKDLFILTKNYLKHDKVSEKDNSLYDIRFFSGQYALENSRNDYFDSVIDYDRVVNPQYYVEAPYEIDHYADIDQSYNEEKKLSDMIFDEDPKYFMPKLFFFMNKELDEKEKIDTSDINLDSFSQYNKNSILPLLDNLAIEKFTFKDFSYNNPDLNEKTKLFLDGTLSKIELFLEKNKYLSQLPKGYNAIEKNDDGFKDIQEFFNMKTLWDFIPEEHQKNLIDFISNKKTMKLKNGISLIEVTPTFTEIKEFDSRPTQYRLKDGKIFERTWERMVGTYYDWKELKFENNDKQMIDSYWKTLVNCKTRDITSKNYDKKLMRVYKKTTVDPIYLIQSKHENEKHLTSVYVNKKDAELAHKNVSVDKDMRLPF